jgi:hypothetical protein
VNGAVTVLPPYVFIAWVGTTLLFTFYFPCLLSDLDESAYEIQSLNGAGKSVLFLWPQKDLIFDKHHETVRHFEGNDLFRPVLYYAILNRRQESNCCCDSTRWVSSAVSSETVELYRPSTKWGTGDCRGRRCGTWRRKAPYCTRVCGVVMSRYFSAFRLSPVVSSHLPSGHN